MKIFPAAPNSVPEVTGFFHDPTSTASYVVADPESGKAAIIDPVLDFDYAAARTGTGSAERIAEFIADRNYTVDWILETHVHADHLTAAPWLKERSGGLLAIGDQVTIVQSTFANLFNLDDFPADGSQFDHLFADGERFSIGAVGGQVLWTPGHTPGCVGYLIGDAVFIGDTLFMPDYGTARCDFPGGDAALLYRSIQRLYALPAATRMFVCHDYPPEDRDEIRVETTVGEQRAHNVHVHDGVSEDDFVAMRNERDSDLSMPALIIPSVQINMRAGEMPPAEPNGTHYLKVPLNRF